MEITLTGTGTSQGVPVIGCDCGVCTSADERDKRLRTAALIRYGDKRIAIDCGPDFRQQMLRSHTRNLDAILLTHEHNDHIIGMDDVRPFNFQNWTDMPVYCTPRVQRSLLQRFAYVFAAENRYPGAPMVRLHSISKEKAFEVAGLEVQPVEAMHGSMPVLGFRIGDFAYLTDVRAIAPEEQEKLKGLRRLVISALHHREHHSHLNLEQALALIAQLGPEQAYLTHLSHRMGRHEEVQRGLPDTVILGYDGLKIRC
ncbi:MAG: MBL fold metallo-hydrolase [Lewinellaceae bacterium]|nr:MBL fold metallo-hydrolase [Phaeodactylibacter sp.]MCB9348749.1 MBL fold metallo-hydrolase [Lewinellaceae bacterium]